ncbi:hypothetical protein LPC27_15610 [Paraclostridium bifermentans]|uniref:hypothetical protein n=1 Tax=Paraclostridium bifermentans TaxID=1490 RepID=UPI001F391FC5|nr:hypothetical protein [Paraclostridium bifermentans]MCE9677205.1 hypothetical protein [Paraclostridium bifermentans]
MFTIDFTKPWLYKDIIYFNQGNLSTNNTLRCKLVTGGSDDFTGGSIACTFTTKDSVEISGFGRLVDAKGGIVDIVFPSNALVVGTNKLEVLVNRADGGVAQSPSVMYDIWQGLTTGNGIEAETNYPILIELINSTNEASNKANLALNKANSMITDLTDAIDNAYRSANEADIATSNANSKITELDDAKTEMITKVDASIDTMKTDVNKTKEDMKLATDAKVKEIDTAITNMNSSVEDAKTDMQATTDAKMQQVDNSIANMKVETNTAIDNMVSKTDEKIADVDRAIAAGTKDLEVKEARRDMDGVEHDTLKLRLESDLKKGKVIEETKEGTYLSFNDTIGGLVSYLEVLGNTVQDASNLANIRSSCIPNGDGTFKMSILSVGENLFDGKLQSGDIASGSGAETSSPEFCRSVNYMKVPKGGSINVNKGAYASNLKVSMYDSNFKYLGYISELYNSDSNVVSLNPNCSYIRIVFWKASSIDISQVKNIRVIVGAVATPYTPYQETRCDIKLPCQLEKWDRLHFDKEENAWCVDKFMGRVQFKNPNLTYNEVAKSFRQPRITDVTNIAQPSREPNDVIQISSVMKAISANSASGAKENGMCLYIHDSGVNELIVVENTVTDASIINSRIKDSWLYYKLKTPQRIVLPQSEQIKLNSFANKTHIYTISGDVDATVKATVSKSLASTVQANANEINILNGKIEDIQGLKESQDFAYETDKGYLICKDTQNGVVKDLKVYGRSWFNLWGNKTSDFSFNGQTSFNSSTQLIELTTTTNRFSNAFVKNLDKLKTNTYYTLIANIIENTLVSDSYIYINNPNGNIGGAFKDVIKIEGGKIGTFVYKIKTRIDFDSLTDRTTGLRTYIDALAGIEGKKVKLQIVLLEGDHTQNPPPYFEGIASVGNGNEIEVSSEKFDGNRFDTEGLKLKAYWGSTVVGTHYNDVYIDKPEPYNRFCGKPIRLKPNAKYYFKCGDYQVARAFFDENLRFVRDESWQNRDVAINTRNNEYYMCSYIKRSDDANLTDADRIFIENNAIVKEVNSFAELTYEPYKQDKKPILFKDTDGTWKPVTELRGIDLNNCDILDSTVNKLYRNFGEVLFNGSDLELWENLVLSASGLENYLAFGINIENGLPTTNTSNYVIDTIGFANNELSTVNNNGVLGKALTIHSNGKLYLRIEKSLLSTPDVAGFKKWLQANNVRIVYRLAQRKVYEVNPLDLESFENETMILIDGGVIDPPASFKITSSLPNFVKSIQDQVRQLQDQVYKTNVANFTVALNTLDTKLRLDRLEAPQQ